MHPIAISAIMTVKNGERYLEDSLSSVFSQTYPPREVVIVNDGSMDSTWDLLQRLRTAAPIPVELVNTKGVGRSGALNLAISHTRYPWLANIDADDLWLPEKLERQAMAAARHPEAELLVTRSRIVYGEVEEELNAAGEFSLTPLSRERFYIRNPINHSSILFTRKFIDLIGGYDETLIRQVDIDLWVRALRAGYTFYRVDMPLTIKRLHDGQSYEVGKRLDYTLNALKLSLRKLKLLKAPYYYFPVPFLKFAYNNMPRSIRRRLIR